MNPRKTDTATRRPALPGWLTRAAAMLGFGLAAAFCVAIGVVPRIADASAMTAGAPLVVVRPRDGVTAPLAIAFACFAAMAALPDLQIHRRPSRWSPSARAANRAATILIGVAAAAVPGVALAPPATALLLRRIAAAHGYAACPPPRSGRYGTLAWALPPGKCPVAR